MMLVDNPHLAGLDVDVLYHLALDTSMDLVAMFGDVKFVVLGGSGERMRKVAEAAADRFGITEELKNLCATDRYSLYKVGPIISVSHGMGMPSIGILLHELAKLMHYAKADDPAFIRIGTSGGLGCEPGTVVITSESLNGALKPVYELDVLGEKQSYSSCFDTTLCNDLLAVAERLSSSGLVEKGVLGKTMCTLGFYNGQGRLDGAWCDHSVEDKMEFLKLAHTEGVRNIEMESLYLAAFAGRLKIRAACLCTTLVDRLQGDQVTAPKDIMASWVNAPIEIVLTFVESQTKNLKRDRGTGANDANPVAKKACV